MFTIFEKQRSITLRSYRLRQQRLSLRAVKLPSGASPDIRLSAERCGHFVPLPRLRVCSWQTLLGLIVANVSQHRYARWLMCYDNVAARLLATRHRLTATIQNIFQFK
jgi:hypothetical protein